MEVEESTVVDELQRDVADFALRCEEQTDGGDQRWTYVGGSRAERTVALGRLAERTRHSLWAMRRDLPFAETLDQEPVLAGIRQRGLATRVLVAPRVVRQNPVLPSGIPHLLVAPVFTPLVIADRAVVVVDGARTSSGEDSSWCTSDREVVAQAVDLFERTSALGRPGREHVGGTLLSLRQVAVAHLLGRGLTDVVIARRLGVSARTVTSELRAIMDHLGVDSRTSAASVIADGRTRDFRG